MEIWITGNDIMTVAKIYNLSYAEATDKTRELVEAEGNTAVFV
jgi:hypothetical protein